MTRKHARAGTRRYARAAVAYLVLGATALVTGPASATHQPSTASVDLRDVAAGAEDRSFGVTVTHPAGSGPALTDVRIAPPQELLLDGNLFAPLGGTGPHGGWTTTVEGTSVSFRLDSGQGIAPGQSGVFAVQVEVGRPSSDECGTWTVEVSTGGPFQGAGQAAGDALQTCVRVLEVQALSIVAPAGATDNTVTAGQSGVCARMRVANQGSSSMAVVPQLQGSGVTVGLARAEGSPPCGGGQLPEGTTVVDPGHTAGVDFRLTFGDAQSTTVVGRATGPGVVAIERPLAVTVQPQATLQYLAGSLFPRSVQPGTEGAAFRLTVNKGPAGSPTVWLDPEETTFSFSGCPPRVLISDPVITQGLWTAELAYEPCDVAEIADGRYDATAAFTYTDSNDFSRTATLGGVSQVRVDGTPPVLDISLQLPTPACCVPPAAPAVKNGDAFRLVGTIKDADPLTGQLQPCSDCFLQTEIRQFQDEGCGTPGSPPVNVSPTNSNGDLTALYTGSYGDLTRSARWHVSARDEAGNSTSTKSACTVVDNVKARIQKAEIERVSGEDRIRVTLDECVGGQTRATDWRVTANVVIEVLPLQCTVSAGAPRGIVVLRALLPSPDEKPPGIVEYAPLIAPAGGRLYDRVNNAMDPQEAEIDGPRLPISGQLR